MYFVDILSAKQHSSLNYCPGRSRLSCSPSLSASTGIRRLSLAFFITYSNRHLNFWDLLLLMSVSSWGLKFPSIICRSPGYNMLSSCLRFDFYLKLTGVSSSLSPIAYTYYFLYFFYLGSWILGIHSTWYRTEHINFVKIFISTFNSSRTFWWKS